MVEGRLVDRAVEAVLRPIRGDLSAVSHASREVEVGCGESVRARLEELVEIPWGGAVITPGGDLPCSFIIHVVVETSEEPISIAGVERALVNGLRRAQEWEISSLALPPLGVGPGQLEADHSASVMAAVLQKHLSGAETLSEVEVVVDSEYLKTAFLGAF